MRTSATTLYFLLSVYLVRANPIETSYKASCEVCHPTKEGYTNVHLIPHTHDDVGWLKTVDQYFYGQRPDIQKAAVQIIIDSVVDELSKYPDRRFIYVETAFLKQWWDIQSDERRAKMRTLIEKGQLELISGAWSMHDEAVTHYHSIIDQFTLGFGTIDQMFDGLSCAKPKIGWQIDPFGHARETASILAQMGFDGLFFARLDHQDRARRIRDKEMEFVWRASESLGNASSIFTQAFYKHYSAPSGYCFDLVHCNDQPINENPNSGDYNVPNRVNSFIEFVNSQKDTYQTEHMLVTMGDDFTYQQAASWFDNIDRLIKHVNAEQKNGSMINLLYSTPSCYLQAVHRADKVWKTKSDDLFPYADGDHSFWTGYYTSRPTLKYMERRGNNLLQVCKQLSVLAELKQEKWEDLDSLREAMGVMQHHDAITGTEKQHVADDYAKMLHKGMLDCAATAAKAINKLSAKITEAPTVNYESCLLLNVSQCEISESNDRFVVTLYNPLAQEASTYVRLPVQNFKYTVSQGSVPIATQMLKIPDHVLRVPYRTSTAVQELVFKATIPPLGFQTFYVTKTAEESAVPAPVEDDGKFTIQGNLIQANVDPTTGLFESLYSKQNGLNYTGLSQNFYYYLGSNGDMESSQSSGAYIFRPNGNATVINATPEITTFKGELVQEIHQKFSDWVSQIIRVYADNEFVEFEWMIGPIPAQLRLVDPGKEVVTRYLAQDLVTNGVFYTDSNGRGSIERKRDYRPTWDLDLKEEIAGNYFPVTTFITTKNETEMTVLTDRAQGGTSLQDGTLELMLHRRLLHDDGRGVGEALNEKYEDPNSGVSQGMIARGRHLFSFAPISDALGTTATAKARRWSRDNMILAPWAFFAPTDLSDAQWLENYEVVYQGINNKLPENVNILTLEPMKGGEEVLVRFEHFYEPNDDPALSANSLVPIYNLTKRFGTDKMIEEMSLGANRRLAEVSSSRLQFRTDGAGAEKERNIAP
ncbi:Hypothetical predicted protein [Cloeon dipterum]|uniref:Alpha-mannosidase n=1 Tax=Cloeon dipterum TaxID=197152 RepID=A0A8S1D3C2_9INSE|nr:Hypothetical predicted protein [Cloeon dipterum]